MKRTAFMIVDTSPKRPVLRLDYCYERKSDFPIWLLNERRRPPTWHIVPVTIEVDDCEFLTP